MSQNHKHLDTERKIIIFYEKDLYEMWKNNLKRKIITPYDLNVQNVNIQTRKKYEYYYVLNGYSVVINIQNKECLLLFNKRTK